MLNSNLARITNRNPDRTAISGGVDFAPRRIDIQNVFYHAFAQVEYSKLKPYY